MRNKVKMLTEDIIETSDFEELIQLKENSKREKK
jgi:hypothetical protein